MRAKIPATFRRNGYDYELLRAETRPNCPHVYAIYAQSRSGGICAYETLRLRHRSEGVINGKVIPAGPKLPGNEAWGVDGFTHWTEAAATARMQRMVAEDTARDAERLAA